MNGERANAKLPQMATRSIGASVDSMPDSHASERHFSVKEIAALWGLSEDAARRLFEKESGVLVLSNSKPGKRRYRTFRIPESVAQRVHRKLSLS